MGAKRYTLKEVKVIKSVAKDWKDAGRNPSDLEKYVSVLTEQLPDRPYGGLKSALYLSLRTGSPVNKYAAGRKKLIQRGERKYTPEGLKKMQENGRNRWAAARQKLASFGLTEEQIAQVFSNKIHRLSKDQVQAIEKQLATFGRAEVNFLTNNMGISMEIIEQEKQLPIGLKSAQDVLEGK